LQLLFSATAFLSSFLLFLIQPMAGKNLLPSAGGSPATWNSCMVFFQLLLLGGYLWTHLSVKKAGINRQSHIQTGLAILALLFLPVLLSIDTDIGHNPAIWLILQLAKTVGLPFFFLAGLSPLLQVWFSNTAHPLSKDPYFLYAAGNCGSFAALLAYPLFIEPNLRLAAQANLFGILFVTLLVLLFFCRRHISVSQSTAEENAAQTDKKTVPISEKLKWVMAAFVPSSLLLAATQFITTDLAPVPFLWILPLMVYLATFIIAFSRIRLSSLLIEKIVITSILLFPAGFFLLTANLWVGIPLHLFTLFSVALFCHTWLAQNRPDASGLTAFFTLISLGGVLGGMFNTFFAPWFFTTFAEYPLMIIVACLMLKRFAPCETKHDAPEESIALSVIIGLYAAVLLAMVNQLNLPLFFQQIALFTGFDTARPPVDGMLATLQNSQVLFRSLLIVVFSLFPLFLLKKMPRLNLALFTLIVMSFLFIWKTGHQSINLARARNFFGIKSVQYNPQLKLRSLVHGTTVHGNQCIEPAYISMPLTYFHPKGPVGQIFQSPAAARHDLKAAILGMGIGSIAAYSRPGNEFVFYELDPQVISIAQNSDLFTFISDNADTCRIVCGDGRQMIRQAPENYFDMIFFDAFSSGSVPVHLITIEAINEYLLRLKPDGLLIMNITNRYLDLKPVLAAAAKVCDLKAITISDQYFAKDVPENFQRFQSEYVVLAKDFTNLQPFVENTSSGWQPLDCEKKIEPWTDDFSSLLAAINFRTDHN